MQCVQKIFFSMITLNVRSVTGTDIGGWYKATTPCFIEEGRGLPIPL